MDVHALTIEAVRDGPVCTLLLRGDLDLSGASGFLTQAALVIDDRTDRLVLDLAGPHGFFARAAARPSGSYPRRAVSSLRAEMPGSEVITARLRPGSGR
jgi:hypothetical protein